MSWLFSQALAEEFSAGTSLDGQQFAQLNVMPTPHKFWRNDKTMDASDLSRFGLTLRLLTDDLGEALLTWYREASPARTSVLPDEAQALPDSEADSGVRWQGSLARYDRDTSTWKTAQCSLLGDSELFSETWPRWGSMRNGASYLRPIPALPTFESESGLWQTPVADDAVNRVKGKWNSRGEPKLSAQVLVTWPTPVAQPANGTPARFLERKREWVAKGSTMGITLSDLQLAAVASERGMEGRGQLNPDWVEWLMGWPIGWTDSKPLEMDKFQAWQQQHGGF